MNNKFTAFKMVAGAIVASLLFSNCVTTYDAQGVAVGQNNGRDYYRGGRGFRRGRY